MKIKKNKKRQDGSVLLLVLLISVVMMSTLASYLYLVSNERTLAARSQDWNSAIPVAEAGIEEAMTQLAYAGTNNLGSNSWTLGGDGMYHKTRTLTTSSFYGTAIQMAAQPIIWSTGYVASPFHGTDNNIKRLVRVVATKTSGFGYGILAKGQISLSGGAFVDSFDSTDPTHSTNHLYNPATATTNATVLTDSSAAKAITLSGGSFINGLADTGPGGTVDLSGSAYVTTGRNDANVQINDIAAPTLSPVSSSLATSTTVNGTNYDFVATTGNYELLLGIALSGSQTMAVNGNVVIYLPTGSTLHLSGSSSIYMTPGSTLTVYTAVNIDLSGSGVFNGSQSASALTIYGLPGCVQVNYSGSSAFIGVVDAPEAALTLSGSAGASGAYIASSVALSGSAGVHYDTSLGSSGQGYVVQSWNEMPAH